MPSLNSNVVVWAFPAGTVEATKYLNTHRIPFQVMRSDQGHWVNVHWKNGITAPLTHQELYQLPDYLALQPRRNKL